MDGTPTRNKCEKPHYVTANISKHWFNKPEIDLIQEPTSQIILASFSSEVLFYITSFKEPGQILTAGAACTWLDKPSMHSSAEYKHLIKISASTSNVSMSHWMRHHKEKKKKGRARGKSATSSLQSTLQCFTQDDMREADITCIKRQDSPSPQTIDSESKSYDGRQEYECLSWGSTSRNPRIQQSGGQCVQ